MRTTIEISDELCRQLKRKAADEGVNDSSGGGKRSSGLPR